MDTRQAIEQLSRLETALETNNYALLDELELTRLVQDNILDCSDIVEHYQRTIGRPADLIGTL